MVFQIPLQAGQLHSANHGRTEADFAGKRELGDTPQFLILDEDSLKAGPHRFGQQRSGFQYGLIMDVVEREQDAVRAFIVVLFRMDHRVLPYPHPL